MMSVVQRVRIPILLGGILLLAGLIAFLLEIAFRINAPRNIEHMEEVTLRTTDGVQIAADYYRGSGSRGILLIHMMPATKDSWRDFASKLQQRGWDVLAIDLRGHGKSQGGPKGYLAFSDAEHQKSILDVEAGIAFLETKGIPKSAIVIAGASIGANLALWYAADHPEIRQVVLLSAGLNYRGIATEPLVAKLQPGQRVFFATSKDDGDNATMNQTLYELVPPGVEKHLITYTAAGHGTNMFGKEEPDLAEAILQWLR